MKILNRWTDAVLWEGEAGTVAEAVYAALKTGANLRGADLRGANLTDANLTGANLTDADLTDADLTGANLRDADLTDADLTDADLTGANLRGANLTGANLTGANLTVVRDDLWAVLSAAPAEVPGLLAAVREGRINGSQYTGACACLVGTIANVRGCHYEELPLLAPNGSRPAEVFFLSITTGDTPETHPSSKLAEQWISEWLTVMRATFGATA